MANVTYTVPNKNGSYDGDYVVKQYTTINIDAGDTVTVDQPCRGLMLLCTGNCTINGTLSMRQRGALANPGSSGGSDSNATQSAGLQLPFLTSGGSDTLTAANTLMNGCGTDVRSVVANFKTIGGGTAGTILQITRYGAGNVDNSQDTATSSGLNTAESGTSGTNHTGGGGQGASGYETASDRGGSGKSGTCFGGGSGGGGAGNPNGIEATNSGYGGATNIDSGEDGTGGVIWLIVGGDLTIGASGKIDVSGSNADSIDGNGNNWLSGGGGSGGGAVKIAYKGTLTNNGAIDVSGGTGGQATDAGNGYYSSHGGNAGVGTSTLIQVL